MEFRVALVAVVLAVLIQATPVTAQFTPPGGTVDEPRLFEGSELYRQTVGEHASLPTVEFGESWSPDTGEVSFSVSDLSLPGNNPLSMVINRNRSRTPISLLSDGMFGDWELSLPRVEYTWRTQAQQWFEATRCRNPLPASQYNSGSSSFQPYAFFFGMTIHDLSAQSHLIMTPDTRWPATAMGAAPSLTTKSLWKISCLAGATNGHDGFLATSPDGTTYRFDREIHRRRVKLNGTVENVQVSVYPSVVTDVNGNTITYTYGTHGPTRVQSSDGRVIDLVYNAGGQVAQVTANSRTWNYYYQTRYGRPFLHRVVRPDGHEWRYEGFESIDWANHVERDYLDCTVLPGWGGIGWRPAYSLGDIAVVHPNGARLEVTFANIKNGRSKGTPRSTPNYWYTNRCKTSAYNNDNYVVSLAVTQKRIVQPSGATDTWNYTYSQDEGSYSNSNALSDTKLRTEIRPDGTRAEFDVFRVNNDFKEGEVVDRRVYTSASGGALLEREYATYESIPYAPGYPPLPASFGSAQVGVAILRQAFHYLVKTNVLQRGADTYTTSYAYTTSGAGFALNNPTTIQKTSNVGGGTRTSTITYANQVGSWVVLRPQKEVLNGTERIRFAFDTKGRVTQVYSFGALKATIGWNTDGTTAWAKDALNRQTTFASYKRGTPQLVTRPDGTTYSFVVDNNGWVTSATNPRGYTTLIGHNPVGWITSIDRPVGWSDTEISYVWNPNGVTITETTGSRRTATDHDALNRPVLVRVDDLTGIAASVYQKISYDGLNRVAFASFPSESTNLTTGTDFTYDALGRQTQARQNISPYSTTVTEYLAGNKVRVTDPVGNQTSTTSAGFASPDDGYVTRIDQPLGVSTVMTHDSLGYLLTATQNGGGASTTQSWAYDSQHRLCAHSTPEAGTRRFEYDGANQLIAYAEGLTGTSCAALPAGKIQIGYDLIGRVTSTSFPGSTPDITTAYDANGNVTAVSRSGVNWTYAYNSLDLLTQEKLQLDARTYQFDYAYNGNGDITSATVPFAGSVTFAPDGLGRTTGLTIGSAQVASLGRYFPNGELKQMNYGNGLAFAATQNARQLTASSQTGSGSFYAVKRSYAHDANGRITSITDNAVAGENRAFTYDGLGRLATATGPWGVGTYTYDALGNLKAWAQGTAAHSTIWDTVKNRPTSATTTGYGTRAISYDSRGNVSELGGMFFVYDEANQPKTVSGSTSGTYTYDGNLKRVKSEVGGNTIYNVYSLLSGNVAITDNTTTGERNVIIDLGAASVRWNPVSGVEITHLDHLGSPVAATDWQGGLLWRESYTPFGDKRIDPSVNRDKPSFTGHIDDAATGLTYMQARYYDPALGRFLSPDPVGFSEAGIKFFNRYAYVSNDPINNLDPSGMYECGATDGAVCKAARAALMQVQEARDFYEAAGAQDQVDAIDTLLEVAGSENDGNGLRIAVENIRENGKFLTPEQRPEGEGGGRNGTIVLGTNTIDGYSATLGSTFAHELEHARLFNIGQRLAEGYETEEFRGSAAGYLVLFSQGKANGWAEYIYPKMVQYYGGWNFPGAEKEAKKFLEDKGIKVKTYVP